MKYGSIENSYVFWKIFGKRYVKNIKNVHICIIICAISRSVSERIYQIHILECLDTV